MQVIQYSIDMTETEKMLFFYFDFFSYLNENYTVP